ncbi:hypothetical protein V5799_019430 [Amblyomma americanum]|uniref:Uncharacterized protein n=1 Tax=Amblyomma americanum TaxID=6943 RepID=A0AAQ4EWW7_AMBAM
MQESRRDLGIRKRLMLRLLIREWSRPRYSDDKSTKRHHRACKRNRRQLNSEEGGPSGVGTCSPDRKRLQPTLEKGGLSNENDEDQLSTEENAEPTDSDEDYISALLAPIPDSDRFFLDE